MILPSRGKKSPPKQICVDQPPPGRLFGTRFRAQTRDLPPRVIRFPHLQRRERPTSARHARSDRRAGLTAGHAPRRAGPEPGAAAPAGRGRGRHAARTAITTPVTPSGPPPQSGGLTPEGCPGDGQGVLPAGGCAGTTTLRPPGKAQGLTWRYCTLTATTLGTHGPKGRTGGAADLANNGLAACRREGCQNLKTATYTA